MSKINENYILKNFPGGVCITAPDGTVLDANQELVDILGYRDIEDLKTVKSMDFYANHEDREKLVEHLENGIVKNYTIRGKRKNGEIIWLSVSTNPIKNIFGEIEYVNFVENITEQVVTREKLSKQEARYKAIVEDQTEYIFRWKPDGTRIFVNRAYAEYYNTTAEKLIGTSIKNEIKPEAWESLINRINNLTPENPVSSSEHKSVFKGKILWKEWTDRALFDENGKLYEIQSTGRDITQRKQAQYKQLASERRYKALFEKSSDPTLLIEDGIFIECNNATLKFLKIQNNDKVVGKTPWELSPEFQFDGKKSDEKAREMLNLAISNGNHRFEWLHKDSHNNILWVDVSLTTIPGLEKTNIYTVWRDITSQRTAELKLRENEALLKATLESTAEGFLVVNNRGEVTNSNSNFQKIWKIPDKLIQTKNDEDLLSFVSNQLKEPESFLKGVDELYKSNRVSFDILDFADGRKIERYSYPLLINESIEGRVWSFNDVTERYQAQEKIRESELRFKQLVENLPDAIFVTRLGGENKGKILDVNPAAETQTGYTREELLTKKIGEDLLEKPDEEKFQLDENKLLKDGLLRLTERKKRKDGTIYWVEVVITTIQLKGEKVALAVNRDITELKNSEEALKESQQNLSLIYDTVGVGLFRITVASENEFTIHSVNNTYLQITERKINETVNRNIKEIFDTKHFNLALRKYAQAIKQNKTVTWEETALFSGGEKALSLSVTPVYNEKGKCISLVGVVHDVSEKKKSEAQIIKSQSELEKLVHSRTVDLDRSRKAAMNLLQDSNEQRHRAEEALKQLKKSSAEIRKLSQVVEQNPAAVAIIDINGDIEYVNKNYIEKTGYTAEEVLGKNPACKVFSNTLPSKRKDVWEKITRGEIWYGEIMKSPKQGNPFWESVLISPLYDENKSIISFIRIGQDITQRKKLEEDLMVAKEQADEATKAKSEFLANMSHEIRTPMNAILGFADLLSVSIQDTHAKNYLNSLKTSGKSLLNLINDILDLSKVEAGMLQLSYEFINLNLLFQDIQQIFSIEIANKKLKLILDIDPSLPPGIFLDEARLRQVLINLANNAVKFTEKGSVKLKAYPEKPIQIQPGKKNFSINLIIEVEDTGIGISEDFQKIIFDSFTQHEGHDTKKHGGTGLGLAISQKLVKLMNGQILLESKLGKGSTFKIFLPDTLATNASIKKKKSDLLGLNDIIFESSTVLIVDDVYNNLVFFSGILEYAGLNVLKARNGEEALHKLKTNKPDLVITDIRMPVMDGIELFRFMRQTEDLKDIPIVSSSASTVKDKENMQEEIHFDGYLSKPIQIPELLQELTKHIKHTIVKNESKELTYSDYPMDEISDKTAIKMVEEAQDKLLPMWKQIKDRQPVKKVEEFGIELESFGEKYNTEAFTNYGADIRDAIKSFNIEEVVKLIKIFPELLEKLQK